VQAGRPTHPRGLQKYHEEAVRTVHDSWIDREGEQSLRRWVRSECARIWPHKFAAIDQEKERARNDIDALEELYADANDHRALLDVLRRKGELASDPAARRRLLVAQAQLCEGPLSDTQAAITAYESVLEEGDDKEAMVALERLYAAAERWELRIDAALKGLKRARTAFTKSLQAA